MKITIPHLPYKDLNPNNKSYWPQKYAVAQVAKDEVISLLREQGYFTPLKKAHLSITFYSKDWIHRDLDNLLAAMKSSIDGVVAAGVIAGDDAERLSISLKYEHADEYATVMEIESC
ncbi:hypothetical protein LCGC14_1788990 [marine sediment metagenome]|uniref:Uncharacterized protein n=1 Tax=marine sediment metagenome TaxID=412755 RepID=A0A0F9JSQ6_9ZZZZ